MVARRARVRVAAREGLERHHRMPARCGHCSTRASDQMLRRIVPTAERTVSPGQRPKAIDKGAAIRERPRFARKFEFWWIGSFASICPACWCAAPRRLAKMGSAAQAPTTRNGLVLPLDFTGCLASWIDRSRHLLLVLQTPNLGLASSRPP
jgi:hypothetical protein